MGNSNIDVPPIPGKKGTYEYDKGNIVYKVKGEITGTIVAPYIPPKRKKLKDGRLEDEKDYQKRIIADVNQVIAEIETSKDHVDAKARKHATDSTYELGDTGLTFASAFKKAAELYVGEKGEISKKDITIPGIIVKSSEAGLKELKTDIVGDLKEGFNLGNFFAKYGPALNEAIWRFGYGYRKDGLTNRHLLYMVYIVKKHNILNAIAAQIMELTMVKGLYLLHEVFLISKPGVTDKDSFFQKVKKYGKAAGKEFIDYFRAIQGLFWIFISGAVADLIKDKIDSTIFDSIDELIMAALGIAEDNNKSRQESNKDYSESFEEIYKEKYQELEQIIRSKLTNAEKIEVDLGECLGDMFEDLIEKLIKRYNIINKIFGADKAYTVYKIRNIGQEGIKLIKEEAIDGPGLGYGSKIVLAQGGMYLANIKFFDKFEETMKSRIGKNEEIEEIEEETGLAELFTKLAVNTKAGNFVTRKAAQVGTLAAELNFLRKEIVFTEERKTGFQGLRRLHGDLDDISLLVQTMFDNGLEIESIPDFLAYFDEEGKRELEEYIKALEGNKSNNSSLESPKKEKYSIIVYEGEKNNNQGEKEERQVIIGYYQTNISEKVKYVEVIKDKLPEIYQKTDKIYLTDKNLIFLRDSYNGITMDSNTFIVKKITLEEVAKRKGVISLEQERGRLKDKQSYIGDFITVDEIRKYNKEKQEKPFPLEISPGGDYLILYCYTSSAIDPHVLTRFILGKSNNEVTDVKFPYEEYIANHDILYGDYKEEQTGTREEFEFWPGIGSSRYYQTKIEDSENNSNPAGKIVINGEVIGQDLQRIKKVGKDKRFFYKICDSFLNYFTNDPAKSAEYKETITKKDGSILEVYYEYKTRYFISSNTDSILGNVGAYPSLIIKYRNQGSKNDYNTLVINQFNDLNYGIDIPDKGDTIPGSNYKNEVREYNLNTSKISLEGIDGEFSTRAKIKDEKNNRYITAREATLIKEDEKQRYSYTVQLDDTLSEIAEDYYGKASLWEKIERENGTSFTEEEAEKLQIGETIYLPEEKTPIRRYYQDSDNIIYVKDRDDNLYINYYDDGKKTETLYIEGFQEGDYGLWISERPPYYYENGEIIHSSTRSKNKEKAEDSLGAAKGEIFAIEENKYLGDEDRLIGDFLWIYPGDEIMFPVEEVSGEGNQGGGFQNQAAASSEIGEGYDSTVANGEGASSGISDKEVNLVSKGRYYVVDGVIVKCSKGTAPGKLTIIDKNQVYIKGNPIGIIDDNTAANIPCLGTCKRHDSPPCTPKPTGKWKGGKSNVVIHDKPVLLETSTIKCAYGGTITIVDPGQKLITD